MASASNDSSNSNESSSNNNSTPSNSGGSNNNNNTDSGSTSNNNSSENINANNNSSGNGDSQGNNGDTNSGGNKDGSGKNNGNANSNGSNNGNNNSGGNDISTGNDGNNSSKENDNSSGSSNSGQNGNNNSNQNNNSGENDKNNNTGQNNNNNNNKNNSGQSSNNNSDQNNNQANNNSNQNNNNNNSRENINNNNNNNNNNIGANSNSQGNYPPPPRSSNWHAPQPLLSSRKSHSTTPVVSNDNKEPSTSNLSSSPLFIGLAAGAGLLFVILLLFLACSKRKKKRQSSHLMENPDLYRPHGPGSDYWQSGPYKSNQNVLQMSPPPPLYDWTSNPSAHHPHMVSSSELNSSNFSGPHGPIPPPPHPSVALGFNTSTFTYEDLAAATSGFSQAKLLGQGGFGFVHKGVLPNGKEIAVKSLKAGSGQGDREFAAEVEIISRVHHRHLVSLVGYCLNGDRKLLVYEFVPNNTLEFHLYNKNRPSLEWASRIKIALGSAKGLAYLHEDCHPKIIHRDIKAANILIDEHYEAKVADFGLAKLNQENVTHVSTRIMGTFGYLAPEYASTGKLTDKSDVFSFGIMLLELITGRRPVDTTGDYEEDTLVDWARPLLIKAIEERDYSELADPRLENKYDQEEMARMIICASTSVRHSAKKRPKMSQIVRALEGDVSLDDLHEGIKPNPSALFGGSTTSSEFESDSYNANMKNLRKPIILGESQDYPSSEYGNNSSSDMTRK